MSNGIGKNPLNDISKVYLDQVAEKKDDSYLETDMKKRQKNNEKARKELAKGPQMKNPHFESVEVEEEKKPLPKTKMFRKAGNLGRDAISTPIDPEKRQKAYDRSKKIIKTLNQNEGLDPVGKEDGDVNNDGKKDSSDKYLMKRRKAIAKSLKKEEVEVPKKDLKRLVAKAVKRVDADVDGDVDGKDSNAVGYGEFVPSVDGKKKIKTNVQKESFSNWRQDLSEVIANDDDEIKEKKVNNKIKINPKLDEAIEEIGGTLLEEIEVVEMDIIIEGVYIELIEEGYLEDDVEDAIENAMEATVTFGSDTKELKKDGSRVGSKRKFLKRKAGEFLQKANKKVGMAVAQARVDAYNKKREVKQSVADKTRKTKRAVTDAPKKAKQGLKNFVKNKAQKVVDSMSEEIVDEAMMAGPRKDAMKKKEYSAKSGSDRATAFNVGTRRDVSVSDPKIKSRGGRDDKRTGEGDRGMGNAAKRRMKEEASMSPQEIALQKKKAIIDRMIAQKRQQGLNKAKKSDPPAKAMGEGMECDHSMKGKECPVHGKKDCSSMKEATEDSLRDRRMERGGVDGNNRYNKAPGKPNTFGKKKPVVGGPSTLEKVKASIRAKHGQGAIKEDAKMAKQSDEKLAALHKQVSSSDQSLPSNQFMMKRVSKEMNRRKKAT